MQNAHSARTPMDPGYTTANDNSEMFTDTTLYRSLIGALLYLAVNARPDLSVSVGLLGRKVSEPNTSDWSAAKRILRYLNSTKDYKLTFGPRDGWNLVGYSDSDWAGDRQTRRSTTGVVFFFGGGPLLWMSKGQDSVALSSLEAEYNALTVACQEAVWLRRLLRDLNEPQSGATIINEDNQGCLSFAKAERISGRVKHIDTKSDMIADALTKPLGPALLKKFVDSVGLSD
ncbi:uncharacterized protein LOC129718223 [Wyeomyia smithii]|uniref:uncharacterized protein LOC129718223 n=1 Tax=Wyeomyia smithii TaxID=174621 RepID=UPI002467F267|nr:uncharacterized protein LOC129718223 [Wyeomyia smithii]